VPTICHDCGHTTDVPACCFWCQLAARRPPDHEALCRCQRARPSLGLAALVDRMEFAVSDALLMFYSERLGTNVQGLNDVCEQVLAWQPNIDPGQMLVVAFQALAERN